MLSLEAETSSVCHVPETRSVVSEFIRVFSRPPVSSKTIEQNFFTCRSDLISSQYIGRDRIWPIFPSTELTVSFRPCMASTGLPQTACDAFMALVLPMPLSEL